MWKDYYLKFNSYEDYYETMPPDLQLEASHTHATDILGTLYHQETFEPLQGFHVNLRLREDIPLPPGLESVSLAKPAFPKRVFA